MNVAIERITEVLNPTNNGYGVVWAIICPETNTSGLFGAKDFRKLQDNLKLTDKLPTEQAAFLAEALYAERGYRCPAFVLSPCDFETSMESEQTLPYTSYRFAPLPKNWFVRLGRETKH